MPLFVPSDKTTQEYLLTIHSVIILSWGDFFKGGTMHEQIFYWLNDFKMQLIACKSLLYFIESFTHIWLWMWTHGRLVMSKLRFKEKSKTLWYPWCNAIWIQGNMYCLPKSSVCLDWITYCTLANSVTSYSLAPGVSMWTSLTQVHVCAWKYVDILRWLFIQALHTLKAKSGILSA